MICMSVRAMCNKSRRGKSKEKNYVEQKKTERNALRPILTANQVKRSHCNTHTEHTYMPHTLRCRNTFGSHLNTWPCPSQNVKHGSNHFIRSEWMKDGIQSCQGVSLRRAFVSDESCLARLFSYLLFAVEGLWLYAYPGQSSNSSQCFSLRKKKCSSHTTTSWLNLFVYSEIFFFLYNILSRLFAHSFAGWCDDR